MVEKTEWFVKRKMLLEISKNILAALQGFEP